MIFSLIFSVVLGIMSILLLLGKGSWLIAGYNTASKEEKEKYNEKKLCRTVGIMLLFIAIASGLMGVIHNEQFIMGCITFEVIIIIIGIVYANTGCKKK